MWYPIKARADANALARRAAALDLPKTLRLEVTVRHAEARDRLNGAGLLLVNPPWNLQAEMPIVLPALAGRLADAEASFSGSWAVETLVGEKRTEPAQE